MDTPQAAHAARRTAADAELSAAFKPIDPEFVPGWVKAACGQQVPREHLNGSKSLETSPPFFSHQTLSARLVALMSTLKVHANEARAIGLLERESSLLHFVEILYRTMAGHVPNGWPGYDALSLWTGRELGDAEVQASMPLDPDEKRRAEGKLEVLHRLMSLLTIGDVGGALTADH
jgi:hypothetical protein